MNTKVKIVNCNQLSAVLTHSRQRSGTECDGHIALPHLLQYLEYLLPLLLYGQNAHRALDFFATFGDGNVSADLSVDVDGCGVVNRSVDVDDRGVVDCSLDLDAVGSRI